MKLEEIIELAKKAGLVVTLSSYESVHKFAALHRQALMAEGWRKCAEGQTITQHCAVAEENARDAERYQKVKKLSRAKLLAIIESAAIPIRYGGQPFDAAIDRARSQP